jgi:TolB-like protein/DNA-binding winged helix-turn-helix (wHTH) protein/Tfp pilus assembly protein PilF
MDISKNAEHSYEFGPFRLETSERRLLRDEKAIPLSPKVFETLLVLVENGGRTVGKDDLIEKVWPDTFVEESSLTQNIFLLRKALGEESGQPQFIETIPRRGYRFIAPVRAVDTPLAGADEVVIRQRSLKEVIVEESEEVADEVLTEPRPEDQSGSTATLFPRSRLSRWSRRRKLTVALLVLLLASVGVVYLWRTLALRNAGRSDVKSGLAVRSLAILPFKQLGNESPDEYLGLGMADALISKLGNYRQLSVMPTSTILRYTGRDYDVRRIASDLGVDAVIDGTVQRAGQRVRVTVMLINAADGTTLWSNRFDERYSDIFSLQDSISERVAEALELPLSVEERKLLTKHHTNNSDAYHSYLTGLYFWNKRTKEGLYKAVEEFKRAIEQDPNYALAYAGLADSYNLIAYYDYQTVPSEELYAQAKAMATKALEIDNTLAEAYTALAMISADYDKDGRRAEDLYRRAIDSNPNYPAAHVRYGWFLLANGNLESAFKEMKRAQELDPVSPYTNTALGEMYYYRHNFDEAIQYSRRGIELEGNMPIAHYFLAVSYEQKGMYEEAIGGMKKYREIVGNSGEGLEALGHMYAMAGRTKEARAVLAEMQAIERANPGRISPLDFMVIHEGLGERDKAFEWADKAFEKRVPMLGIIYRFDPRLVPLKSDPRYLELPRRHSFLNVRPLE